MATSSITLEPNYSNSLPSLFPVKDEPPQSPQLLPPPPMESTPHQGPKIEPQDLPITLLPVQQEQQSGNSFVDYVMELGTLSGAINTFKRRFDELHKHLEFIENAIDAKFNEFSPSLQNQQQQQQGGQNRIAVELESTLPVKEIETRMTPPKQQPSRSELQHLCEMMSFRELRKYIVSNLSNVAKLRKEFPAALKLAPKPAKLVLDTMGRFFVQGRKAFSGNSAIIPLRDAAVLLLEFFLLMMGESDAEIEIEHSVKEQAESDAVAWRKRLISEGGVSNACEIDARGLLLFVACFGIPPVFKNDDIRNLIRMSNSREISGVLRRSRVLVARIPDLIEEMVKNGMQVEAVDIAFTFGFEDRFPPQTILTLLLQESKEAWLRVRHANGSPAALINANEKQLGVFKSVIKCLEYHKIDPANLLPGWKIKEKIIKFERDNANLRKRLERQTVPKRKAHEIESSSKVMIEEEKRLRFTVKGSPQMVSAPIIGLQEQRAAILADDALVQKYLNSGISAHVNAYPAASSVLHGASAVPLPENVLSTTVSGGNVHGARLGAGASPRFHALPSDTFAGVQRESQVDKFGQRMDNNSLPYGSSYRVVDAANNDLSIGQSFVGKPSSARIDGLFRPSSIEGFAGRLDLPFTSTANRSAASDLYSFADTVLEGESYTSGSHKVSPLPPRLSGYHPSYMH